MRGLKYRDESDKVQAVDPRKGRVGSASIQALLCHILVSWTLDSLGTEERLAKRRPPGNREVHPSHMADQGHQGPSPEEGSPQPHMCASDTLMKKTSYCWKNEIITRRHHHHEAADL